MHKINRNKLNLWIKNSSNIDVQKAKIKLVKNLNYVSATKFKTELSKIIESVNNELLFPYAVLWDYKPHSSKRWVYHKAKRFLSQKPKIETYFTPVVEKVLKILPSILSDNINSILIMDDACYSGEQLINKTIKPVCEFFNNSEKKIKLIIAIPYITNKGLDRLNELIDIGKPNVELKILYQQFMPSISEILDKKELQILEQNSKTMGIQEFSYTGATLTYFSHRVADDHSFAEEFSRFINKKEKPYGDNDSSYSQKEKKEWLVYWKKWTDTIKKDD